MDYASLTLQIQNWANRTDTLFTDQIPNFINQGISRIYSEAKSIGFQKITGGAIFTPNIPLITKPNDWKETISLSYIITGTTPTTVYILPRTYEFCRTYSPITNATGNPVFYADFSLSQLQANPVGQIFISPTPAIAYPYQLIYLSFPLFNTQNPVNFLTDRYPRLLLYACLLESAPFLKDDERIATIENLYNSAKAGVLADTTGRYTDRLSTRDKD